MCFNFNFFFPLAKNNFCYYRVWYQVTSINHFHIHVCLSVYAGRRPLRSADSWTCLVKTSSVTAVLPLPGQRCGTVCLNSFGNRTSPWDNLNDRWKRLCLVSWAAAPCVWTSRELPRNLLTYLLTYLLTPISR